MYATNIAHHVSEVVEVIDDTPEPKWAGLVRTLGLLLPSSWVWLTVCLWWSWRLLALYARGDFEAIPAGSTRLLLGLVGDVAAIQTLFASVRLVAAVSSRDRDARKPTVLAATSAVMAIMAGSALLRIVDLVYCALEHSAPTADFWFKLLSDPASVLLHGGVLAAGATALATAAVGRYALNCDLETSARLAARLPQSRSLLLSWTAALAALATLLGCVVASHRASAADWGRSPELFAVHALGDALQRREQARVPRLEP